MADSAKEEGKGIMETVFGSTSCAGRRGLMFVGFIAPAGLGDLSRLISDPSQVESLLKRAQEEAAKRDAEKEPAAVPAASVGAGSRR